MKYFGDEYYLAVIYLVYYFLLDYDALTAIPYSILTLVIIILILKSIVYILWLILQSQNKNKK